MARASWSAGCAPETAYFCANTNVGTPEMPLSEASLRLRRDQRHVLVGRKPLAHVVGVEPDIGRRLHQHVGVGEIAAVPEIQLHQPLFHLGRFALASAQ